MEDCVGNFSVACSCRSVVDNLEWAFARCMILLMVFNGGIFGKNWLAL